MKNGWPIKTLGDLCQLISGQHIEAKNYNTESRGIGYLTGPSDFGPIHPILSKWTEFPKIKARSGDVLITVKGSGVGKINLLDQDEVAISRQLMAVRVRNADPRFIHAFLGSTFDHFQSISTGAAIPGISREQVLALAIALPPLPEQQRIVGILDEAFDGITTAKANAEKNLQNARALFEGHLHAVFTARGASNVERKLEDVCHEIIVGHVGSMAARYTDHGIPFLRSQNIRPFRVSLENVVFIDKSFHRSLSKSQLTPGDVAVVRTGYPGTAAVIPESLPVSNCSDLVIVRPGPNADPYYLALFFNSRLGKLLVAGQVVGAAQKHFNVTAAKQVSISFPPVLEQRRLVAKLEQFGHETERLESIYQQKIAALDELKKSLLHEAFSGNL